MTIQEKAKLYQSGWSEWRNFPNPQKKDSICAPFGPGVYQLRNKKTGEFILFGQSKNVAHRMTSLLPNGSGTRKNTKKSLYVGSNLNDVEYRTIAFKTEDEAKEFETYVKQQETYIFPF